MKVKELIKELDKMPQDAQIIVAACGMDNEGWMPMVITGWYNVGVSIPSYGNYVLISGDEECYDDTK